MGKIEVWDPVTAELERTVTIPEGAGRGRVWAPSPNGRWLLWGGQNAGLHVVAFDGSHLMKLELPDDAAAYLGAEPPGLASFGAVHHPDGSYEDLSRRYPAYQTACSVALSPDGTAAVAAHGQAFALVWDLRTGRLRQLLGEERSGQPVRIYRVAWSPDGKTILTRDDARRIRLWDTASGRELLSLITAENPHEEARDRPADMPSEITSCGGLGAIAFTPDARYVVAGDGEVIRVWEISSGREVARWIGHAALHPIFGAYPGVPRVLDIRFAADGRRALTVGVDATLRVWDVRSGEEVWHATPDPCCVDWGDISPDGRSVVWAGCPGMRLYAVT